MSSPETTGVAKRSPLFGVSKTRLRALDEGIQKTIANAIQRWTEKRIEFCEHLPEQTRQELHEDGMLEAPPLEIPGTKPAKPQAPARTAPAPAVSATRSRI